MSYATHKGNKNAKEFFCSDDCRKTIFDTKYGQYLVNVGVFDLYPKPLSTIQKHYNRNRDIFRALKKSGLLT